MHLHSGASTQTDRGHDLKSIHSSVCGRRVGPADKRQPRFREAQSHRFGACVYHNILVYRQKNGNCAVGKRPMHWTTSFG